jgi:hypothetical protein
MLTVKAAAGKMGVSAELVYALCASRQSVAVAVDPLDDEERLHVRGREPCHRWLAVDEVLDVVVIPLDATCGTVLFCTNPDTCRRLLRPGDSRVQFSE